MTHKLDQLVGFGGAGQPRTARTVAAAEQGERRQPDLCPGVAETRLNERIRIGKAGVVGDSLAKKILNLKFNPEIVCILKCIQRNFTEALHRRKIRQIESNVKCRYLKKLTCKGTLRQVFICLKPPPF